MFIGLHFSLEMEMSRLSGSAGYTATKAAKQNQHHSKRVLYAAVITHINTFFFFLKEVVTWSATAAGEARSKEKELLYYTVNISMR